ncbi:MAG: prepilin-type N-terminal cleavage/methylation domain-containing protein [Nitrospirae bacterium]|nr:prepilin-type N-terminal cleavage/methylation domain-containing protein [Nitrospirota bacterium]
MKQVMDNRGFTLVELAIVLAVAGIIATIAIPNYLKALPKIRVNQAMADVSGLMIKAKLRAISENHAYIVVFDTSTNSCRLYKDSDHELDADAGELLQTVNIGVLYPGIIINFNVNRDTKGVPFVAPLYRVKFEDLGGTVHASEVFLPSGSAMYSGAVYLIPSQDVAASRYDRNRAITVQAMTGFIKTWSHDNAYDGEWY